MQAIVLSRRDFREYDQLISLYTKERGKLELLARGVKKSTSKNAAHLEPFCFVMVEVVSGKEIDHLTKVVAIDMLAGVRSHVHASLLAGFVACHLDRGFEVEQPDRPLWLATTGWLHYLDHISAASSSAKLVTLTDGYMMTLLGCLGFSPVLDRCVVCGVGRKTMVNQEITISGYQPGLYFAGGGMVCHQCRVDKQQIGEDVAVCGLRDVSNLELLLKADWRLIGQAPLEPSERRALHRLVYAYLVYHSEKQVGDWAKLVLL